MILHIQCQCQCKWQCRVCLCVKCWTLFWTVYSIIYRVVWTLAVMAIVKGRSLYINLRIPLCCMRDDITAFLVTMYTIQWHKAFWKDLNALGLLSFANQQHWYNHYIGIIVWRSSSFTKSCCCDIKTCAIQATQTLTYPHIILNMILCFRLSECTLMCPHFSLTIHHWPLIYSIAFT